MESVALMEADTAGTLILGWPWPKQDEDSEGGVGDIDRRAQEMNSISQTSMCSSCSSIAVEFQLKGFRCLFPYPSQEVASVGSGSRTRPIIWLQYFGKIEAIDEALQLFDELPKKHVVSWNAIILGHWIHGCGDGLYLATDMVGHGSSTKPGAKPTSKANRLAAECLAQSEKPDVTHEREVMQQLLMNSRKDLAIICDNLNKFYTEQDGNLAQYAVQGLPFALPQGDILHSANGAVMVADHA
ncbi:uncharacterized protein [Aristolochia californica]|uniref:uncharacterized protein n=1 Tax=Aristolochia californica TaxID=171875 RepID=UPI0035E37747